MSVPMLWPVYAYGSGERENLAVFFDWSAAVDFVNYPEQGFGTTERYIAEPKYDRRVVSDVLGEQLERDLRFTAELGDAARAARAATPSGLSQSSLASCQHRIAIARKSA